MKTLNEVLEHSQYQLEENFKTAYNTIFFDFQKFNGRCDICEFINYFPYISSESINDIFELVKSDYTDKQNEVIENYQTDCYVTFIKGVKPTKDSDLKALLSENFKFIEFFNDLALNDQFDILALRNLILFNDKNYDDRDILSDYIKNAIYEIEQEIEELLRLKHNCDSRESLSDNHKLLKLASQVLNRLHLIVNEVKIGKIEL